MASGGRSWNWSQDHITTDFSWMANGTMIPTARCGCPIHSAATIQCGRLAETGGCRYLAPEAAIHCGGVEDDWLAHHARAASPLLCLHLFLTVLQT